ncbi:MAG: DMT family transporter [Rhodospirillaceae bacterium]|nr:DMT family transporter [Rhodospirillaceae bacterium]
MNVKPSGSNETARPRVASWVERLALPILVCGSLALALSPIFVRLSEVGPIATAVNRMLLPLPFFFAWMLLRRGQAMALTTPQGRQDLLYVVLAGAFFAGDLCVWHWSINLTSVANSTVLANLAPVFVVAAAWLLFREKVSRLFLMGLVLSLFGVAVLMSESFSVSIKTLTGDALGLSTAWFYAGYILTVARVRKRVPTASVMAWGGLAAVVLLYALAWSWEGNVWPDTTRGWLVAIGLAGVTQLMGQTLIVIALAHVPAGLGAMVLLMQPALAALIAWLLFNAPLSAWQWLGGLAVLAGLEVARRGTPKTPAPEAS